MCRAIVLWFGLIFSLSATTISWTGPNGNWSDITRWSCGSCSAATFPDNGNLGNVYQVSIGLPSTVTLDVSPVIQSVSLSSGAGITGYNGVTLTSLGAYTQSGSATALDGVHTALQSASFSQDAASSLHLTNTASATTTGAFANGGSVILQSGSVLTTGSSLNNTGSLYLVDGNTAIHSGGNLNNQAATLSLYNGANVTASLLTQVASSTVLDGVGTSMQLTGLTQDAASSFHATNTAVTTISGDVANNGGSINLQSGSKLTVSGALSNSGSIYLVDGNTKLSVGSNLSNTSGSVGLYNASALTVGGNYSQTSSATALDGIGTTMQAQSFTQDAGSTFHATNTATTTVGSDFTNAGSINLQSGSKLKIGGSLNNTPGASVFLTDGNTAVITGGDFKNDHASVTLNNASGITAGGTYSQVASATVLDGIGTTLQAGAFVQDAASRVTMTNQVKMTTTGNFINNGEIDVISGSNIQTAGDLINNGAISVQNTNSFISVSGNFDNHGDLWLDGSLNAGTFTLDGGTFGGLGTISAYVYNNGMDQPGSLGMQTILGGYAQGSAGILSIDLGALNSFSRISVAGSANLGGTLRVNLLDGYSPNLNDRFTIFDVTNGTLTANFADFVFPVWNNLTFREILEANAVDLVVVSAQSAATPEPSTAGLLLAGAFLFGLRARAVRRRVRLH